MTSTFMGGHALALPYDMPPCDDGVSCDEGRAYAEAVKGMGANATCSWLANSILTSKSVYRFDNWRYSFRYTCYDVVQNYDYGDVSTGLTWFFDSGKTCSARPARSAPVGSQPGSKSCHEGCSYSQSGGVLNPTGDVCASPSDSMEPGKNNCCTPEGGGTTVGSVNTGGDPHAEATIDLQRGRGFDAWRVSGSYAAQGNEPRQMHAIEQERRQREEFAVF